MQLDVAPVRKCLRSFDFSLLFRKHLGWDRQQAQLDIPVNGGTVHPTAVAQKRGFIAYTCPTSLTATSAELGHGLNKSLKSNAVRKTINTQDGSAITYAEFFAAHSKDIIDKIDRRLEILFGFSDAKADFVNNFDIKYRMGPDSGEDGDE